MKIIRLTAENIKRLVAVEIEPNDNVIKITGKNAQGKTSVLDAIWWALGGRDAIQGEPVRHGARSGRIELETEDLVIERRFTDAGKTYLAVTSKDGMKVKSPQTVLDRLVGSLTFDPLAFTRADQKTQTKMLQELTGLDLSDLDQQYKAAYDERTLVNRQLKQAKAELASLPEVEAADIESESAAELAAELRRAEEHNRKLVEAERRIKALKAELAELEQFVETSEYRDVDSIRERLQKADESAKIRAALEQRKRAEQKTQELEEQSQALTQRLEKIKAEKAQRIESAKMPVEGLSIENGVVYYNGVPFDQASDAEKLRVSLAMGMAMNPELRVMLIRDGSLLDSKSMAIIEEMARDKDYQLWVEIVDESGEVGIYIENGVVAGKGSGE